MSAHPGNDGDIVLWETAAGLRCTFALRASGPPFEVTVQRGGEILKQAVFEHDEDAATFAIAAMRDSKSFDAAGTA